MHLPPLHFSSYRQWWHCERQPEIDHRSDMDAHPPLPNQHWFWAWLTEGQGWAYTKAGVDEIPPGTVSHKILTMPFYHLWYRTKIKREILLNLIAHNLLWNLWNFHFLHSLSTTLVSSCPFPWGTCVHKIETTKGQSYKGQAHSWAVGILVILELLLAKETSKR